MWNDSTSTTSLDSTIKSLLLAFYIILFLRYYECLQLYALRVHLQVCQWSTLDFECLNSFDWGWYQMKDTLEPIKTDLKPAPFDMLNFIRFKCKTSSKNACGSRMCLCFRSGLKCVAACGDCRGEFCNNIFEVKMNNEKDIDRNIFDVF